MKVELKKLTQEEAEQIIRDMLFELADANAERREATDWGEE